MTLTSNLRIPWIGIGLIVMGSVLLLSRLGIVLFGWHALLWAAVGVFGGVKMVEGFRRGARTRVFWGSLLLLVACYKTLVLGGIVDTSYLDEAPVYMVITGLSFILMFASSMRDFHLLVPGSALTVVGGGLLLAEYGLADRWEIQDAVSHYWPVTLILFGALLLVKKQPSI